MGTSVVVVLNDRKRLHQLRDRLAELQPPLLQLEAIGEGEQAMAEVATRRREGLPCPPPGWLQRALRRLSPGRVRSKASGAA